jgi:hypothetical protein
MCFAGLQIALYSSLQQPIATDDGAVRNVLIMSWDQPCSCCAAAAAAAAAADQVRAAGSSDEPYIAAIVSPYNRRLPGLQSSVTWFRVEGGGKAGGNVLEQVRPAF